MYNESRKDEFICYFKMTTSNNFIENLFEKTSIYEATYGKDVCNFIKEEIITLLTGFNSSSLVTLRGNVSILQIGRAHV